MSDSNLSDYASGVVVFLLSLAFIGYGITVTAIGWIGIEEEFGFWWGVAAVVLALLLRITFPITIGAIFGAMHLWGWHWALATLFAIPGLAFMIPAVVAVIVEAFKNKGS